MTNMPDFKSLFDSNPSPNWVHDLASNRIVEVNQASIDHFGYTRDELLTMSMHDLVHSDELLRSIEMQSGLLSNGCGSNIRSVSLLRKNGESVTVNLYEQQIQFMERSCISYSCMPPTGMIHISERKNSDTRLDLIATELVVTQKYDQNVRELFASISDIFKEEVDLAVSLENLCKEIAIYAEVSFCEVWLMNVKNSALRLVARSENDYLAKVFYNMSKSTTDMLCGEGLPGTVWLKRQPIVWDEIGQLETFKRSNAAKSAGIQSVLGIPLTYKDSVLGVLVMGSDKAASLLDYHKPILSKLESYIGSEIHRKGLERSLEHLFEMLPDMICIADFDGRFLKVNQAGCDLLEYDESELIGSHFEQYVHPADVDVAVSELVKLINGEKVIRFENRYLTKSGKVVWLSWHCSSEMAEGVVYGTAKDITSKKKLGEIIEDASKVARIGGWEIDLLNNKLYWSRMVHELHETDPHEFTPDVGRAINFYREDFRELVQNSINIAIENGSEFDFEAVVITAKDNELWVRSIGRVEMLNDQCVRIYGSFQDISKLKETERKLQSLTNDIPGVVFQYALNPNGFEKLSSVSNGSESIWGLSPEECENDINRVWDQIRLGGDFDSMMNDMKESIATKSHWHSVWKSVLPSGELRWHEGFGTPYCLPDNTILFNSIVFDITEEKKAISRYEEVSNLAKVGSWELDLITQDGIDNMYWSPMVRQILEVEDNYNPTLTGGFEFYSEESKQRIKNAVETLIQDGSEFNEELLITTGAGNERWIRCIGKSERANGVCTKVFGSFQNIHSMKMKELQIAEILGSISDAFYATDKNWKFTYFNKEAERLLAKESESVMGKSIWEEFAPAVGTELEQRYRTVVKMNRPESFEYFYPGNEKWYEVNAYPSGGGVSAYFKNIDDRIKASESLKKAYEERNQILESIGDAFFAVDRNFIITYWNKRAEKILNVKREELIGKYLWDMFQDAVDMSFYEHYNTAMKTGEPVTFEENYGMWLEVSAYPSADGLSVFFRDVSERKRYESERNELNLTLKQHVHDLELTNEQLEQFAYIASHDLQEPLRMITSFLGQLQRKYGHLFDDKAHEYIFYATDGAQRMKQIILDLLEYSRAGKFTDLQESISLVAVLKEYTLLRKRVIEEKMATISFESIPDIYGYKAPIVQTLHCIIDNALKYSKQDIPPKISITVKDIGKDWEFSITDNGIGIDSGYFEKIFVIFQRLHDRESYSGTGIGLSIAKKHVESWGGAIWVESIVDAGSVFRFTVPKETQA